MINIDFIKPFIKILDSEDDKGELDKARKTKKCLWNMGKNSPCGGEIHMRSMFNTLLTILMCDNHLLEHVMVKALDASGMDVNDIISIDDRAEKFKEIYGTDTIDRQWCENILIKREQRDKDALKSLSNKEVATMCVESLM